MPPRRPVDRCEAVSPWEKPGSCREGWGRGSFLESSRKKCCSPFAGRLSVGRLGRGGGREERGRERGREGAPVTSQRLSSSAMPWILMYDWPFGDHQEHAILLSTQRLRDGYRNITFTMAAERSEAGSFTNSSAAVEVSVGISSLGTCQCCRSSAV